MRCLIIIFLLIGNQATSQNFWFKLIQGYKCLNSINVTDTLYSLSSDQSQLASIYLTVSNLNSGQVIRIDTIGIPKSNGYVRHYDYIRKECSYLSILNNKIVVGINYSDSFDGKRKWKSTIASLYPLNRYLYNICEDTLDTEIIGLKEIGNEIYAITRIVTWLSPTDARADYKLWRLYNDSVSKVIYTEKDGGNCTLCHAVAIDRIHKDVLNDTILFVDLTDQWDWMGDPQSFQEDIVKLSANGKVLWRCRPNNNDSFNTYGFNSIQLKDGNIIACWTNYNYAPHKKPNRDVPFVDRNDSCTLWFAKIDYKTGNVLWRKNLRTYLNSIAPENEVSNNFKRQDLFIYDLGLNQGFITWIGNRTKIYNDPTDWKNQLVILKTDFEAEPISYREYEIYKNDTGDKGMQPNSFLQLDNGEIIISGEYENQFGSHANGKFLHQAALLHLDSAGCFQNNCGTNAGNKELQFESKFPYSIYPNPASDYFSLKLNKTGEEKFDVLIYNSLGEFIQSSRIDSNHPNVNLTGCISGIYFAKIQNLKDQNISYVKFVVAR